MYFNNIPVNSVSVHNPLGMLLDDKLSYKHNLKFVLKTFKTTIGLLRKFQEILLRQSLIRIYKSFIRPHLDYGDIVYDRAFNESFHKYLESIQYNAAIVITGAIRGTSSEKLLRIFKIETLVKKTMFILQNLSGNISLLSFSANSTKQYDLCYKKFSKKQNLEF